jgi:hypothetical protein
MDARTEVAKQRVAAYLHWWSIAGAPGGELSTPGRDAVVEALLGDGKDDVRAFCDELTTVTWGLLRAHLGCLGVPDDARINLVSLMHHDEDDPVN